MTDNTDRQGLEQRLLANPFDAVARDDYAALLLKTDCAAEALAQYELLCQQQADQASHLIGAACALLALGRREEALTSYRKSRDLDGFEPVEKLEALAPNAVPSTGVTQLRVVSGDRTDGVVQFSSARGNTQKVKFEDIVGADDIKRTIRLQIIEPFVNPGLFQRFRKQAGGGILLYGPPGCGKTMLAKAVASECNAEFISVGISDVLNMWIGESERNLAAIFERARANVPSVLFFDEIDALAYSRSKASSEHTRTVVNELLAQLDGMGSDNRSVLMLAATNMPWDVDPAMRRPGRFARQVFVPPPDAEGRKAMIVEKLADVPCEPFDVAAIARRCEHFSGADIDGLIELAKERALASAIIDRNERPLSQDDFESALSEIVPSTIDWLRTARNLVKFGGADRSYKEVETYLKRVKFN
ncbi:ATP-binding protein [Hwanghaeella grinnelliae]|uniref:ATP-binding protein n=1 Tax=Hwanghaeella grinnelliae TaxID=2500179 RepID=A0A3S2WSZ6_9PROT|nr:ATP-binding protein [Hwanghaeella grinnelliae]RVU37789.1 ATP-binding protein [Hwanghaeella grinnelliae]